MKSALSLYCMLLCFASISQAAEVDSFTHRNKPVEDSLHLINKKINEQIQQTLNKVNSSPKKLKPCNKTKLLYSVKKDLRSRSYSRKKLLSYLRWSSEVPIITTKVKESIYKKFFKYKLYKPIARLINKRPIAAMLKVNGHLIGIDKIEHFFGSGFSYFKKNYLLGRGLKGAIEHGLRAENGHLGASAGGVKSFGDLVANTQGMRFYNHILQENEDIFGENLGPYIACQNNEWVQIKEVDFSDYVDAGMDEGINCSTFRSKKMLRFILKRIESLEEEHGVRYTCPIDLQKYDNLVAKYGKIHVETHGSLDSIILNDEHKKFVHPKKER